MQNNPLKYFNDQDDEKRKKTASEIEKHRAKIAKEKARVMKEGTMLRVIDPYENPKKLREQSDSLWREGEKIKAPIDSESNKSYEKYKKGGFVKAKKK